MGRGNQYIEFARVLYCKLLTNGKQLPGFPLEAMTGIETRPQRWEARVLPLKSDELSNDESVFSMEYTVKSVKARGKQLLLKLSFRTSKTDVPENLECQLNTGTTFNIISFEDYCKVAKSKKPNLQGSDAIPTQQTHNIRLTLFYSCKYVK